MKSEIRLEKSVLSCIYKFSRSRFSLGSEFYITYNDRDQKIPFHPDGDIYYWRTYVDLFKTLRKIKNDDSVSYEEFSNIMDAFDKLNDECVATFKKAPTVIPRFPSHNKKGLHAAQRGLKPINCYPSMHTAYVTFLYGLMIKYFPERKEEADQKLDDLVATVLVSTKHHSLADVALGMFFSEKVLEDELGITIGLEDLLKKRQEETLEDLLTQKQEGGYDRLPEDYTYETLPPMLYVYSILPLMLHDIKEVAYERRGLTQIVENTKKVEDEKDITNESPSDIALSYLLEKDITNDSLSDIALSYLLVIGSLSHPVTLKESNHFVDRKNKKLKRIPGAEVMKGLF